MSWRTTVCGVLAIIAAVGTLVVIPLLDGDVSTVPQWGLAVAAVTTAFGLYFAKDDAK